MHQPDITTFDAEDADENGQGVTFNDRGYLFTQFSQVFERYLPGAAGRAV